MYARRCVGIDFGFGHPFAAALIAWAHDTGEIWVVNSFRMERSSALYHSQRIHAMTRGLRVRQYALRQAARRARKIKPIRSRHRQPSRRRHGRLHWNMTEGHECSSSRWAHRP